MKKEDLVKIQDELEKISREALEKYMDYFGSVRHTDYWTFDYYSLCVGGIEIHYTTNFGKEFLSLTTNELCGDYLAHIQSKIDIHKKYIAEYDKDNREIQRERDLAELKRLKEKYE